MNCIIFNFYYFCCTGRIFFFSNFLSSYFVVLNTFFILASRQQYMCSLYEWISHYKNLLFFVIMWCAFIVDLVFFFIFFFLYSAIFDHDLVTWTINNCLSIFSVGNQNKNTYQTIKINWYILIFYLL